jgi:hypothetical protein
VNNRAEGTHYKRRNPDQSEKESKSPPRGIASGVRKLLLTLEPRTEVATAMFAYRVTLSMVGVFRHGSQELVRPLARGLILIPTSSLKSDGTIEATCGEHRVRVFQRDLIDRTERIELEPQRG